VAAGVGVAVRIGGNVDDAEVYAEPASRFVCRRFGHVHHHGEVERPVPVEEIGLSTNALQMGGLVSAENDGDELPPPERQDGHAVKSLPGEDPLVVDDGATPKTEGWLLGLVPLVGFGDLADGVDSRGTACRALIDYITDRSMGAMGG